MILRFIIVVALSGSLVGCATSQKPTTTGQLQIRVAHIENQLDGQSQDIAQLQTAVEELSQHDSRASVSSASISKTQLKGKSHPVTAPKSNDRRILRVPVTPQDVQTRLKNAGYYSGAIDGKLGSGSRRAIKEFQTDHDLESDGIIGKKTWAELKNYSD